MNITSVLPFVVRVFRTCFTWAFDVFSAIGGAFDIFMVAFSLYITVQLLIMPIRGGRSLGGSDKARRTKDAKKEK